MCHFSSFFYHFLKLSFEKCHLKIIKNDHVLEALDFLKIEIT